METDPRARAIRAMLEHFEREVNTRVPEAIGPYLADDATFITPQGERGRGRAQVQELIVAGMNKGITPEGGIAFEVESILFSPLILRSSMCVKKSPACVCLVGKYEMPSCMSRSYWG